MLWKRDLRFGERVGEGLSEGGALNGKCGRERGVLREIEESAEFLLFS